MPSRTLVRMPHGQVEPEQTMVDSRDPPDGAARRDGYGVPSGLIGLRTLRSSDSANRLTNATNTYAIGADIARTGHCAQLTGSVGAEAAP